MTWKRLLLLAGAAAIIWLKPWRRLRPQGTPGDTAPATLTGSAAPAYAPATAYAPAAAYAPATASAPPASREAEPAAPQTPAAPQAPEATAAAAPAGTATDSMVPPDDAFGVAPEEADLDPVDIEAMDEPAAFGADLGAVADNDGATLAPPAVAAEAGPDVIAEAEPLAATADTTSTAEPEPDAELEAELIAGGEPEPVEMAEDDLIDVPGSVDDATHQADLAEVAAANAADEPAPADEAAAAGDNAGAPAEPSAADAPPDDLLVIEGIGPRTSTIVTAAGYTTFAALADADVDKLREMLVAANIRTIDPTTWPEQARLARDGRMDELRELQRNIKHGKKSK